MIMIIQNEKFACQSIRIQVVIALLLCEEVNDNFHVRLMNDRFEYPKRGVAGHNRGTRY